MRRSLVWKTVLVSVVAFAALAAPCRAEDAAEHAAEQPGLLSIDWYVSVATVVVFLALLGILSKTAWRPILAGLKTREDGIRAQIEGADKANADAKALLADYQSKLAAAMDEAKKIVDEGRKDAETLKAHIEGEAQAEALRERERALRDIEIARQGALKDIYDLVAVVSTDVAGKILQQKLDPAQHRKLVDDGVAAFERTRASRHGPGGRA
jgi:F-type H+-transporting ATPase subunit b